MKRTFLLLACLICSVLTSQQKDGTSKTGANDSLTAHMETLAERAFNANFNSNYSKAIQTNLKLLRLAENLNDHYYLHRAYSLLGYNYLVQDEKEKSDESFKLSEKYALLSKNETALARTYLDMGNLYARNPELIEKSLEQYKKARQLFEKVDDYSGLASVHYHSILAAMETEQYPLAYHHIMAIQPYITHIKSDSFCEISVHSQMARYYTIKGSFDNADIYFKKVIDSSQVKGFWEELENTYALYSNSLFEQGRYKEAYAAKAEHLKFFEKNHKQRHSQENKSIIAKYELEKYKKNAQEAEKEKAYLNQLAENKGQRNLWLTLLTIALVLSLIFLLSIQAKRKNLVNRLREKNAEAFAAQKKAEYLSKSKTKFLSTVSHELRTPLYGVIGMSSLLLEDKRLGHQKENLNSLKFSADYLLALINDVLQINKIDASEPNEIKTTFCLRKLIERICTSFEYMRTENGIDLQIEIDDQLPDLIAGNDAQLSQILMNLIGNAHKFTKNGKLFIAVTPLNMKPNHLDIRFSIKDTGIGIAAEKQQLIFEEFSQIGNGEQKQQGTGLGLSIVKRILDQYNTELQVQSELGKGSEFTFTLPFELIQQKVTEPFEAPVSFADTTLLKNRRILIVDDNAINRMVTKKILEKESVNCSLACNGDEAIQQIQKEDYDLVLMDVNMPVKNGLEATREVRGFNLEIPIIALTAVDLDEMKDKIFASGMNDIVLKPYNIGDFHQTLVNNLMGKGRNRALSA